MVKKGIIFGFLIIFLSGIMGYSLGWAASNENLFQREDSAKVFPFIATQPIPFWGEILGSQEGAVNLAAGDTVYVKLNPSKKVKPGDWFVIGRQLEEVKHPLTKKNMGYLITVPGELIILEGEENIVTAKIRKSTQPILLDDKIFVPSQVPREETAIKTSKIITGQVMFSLDKAENITQREYIFIDRGSQDGVVVGNIFNIYRIGYFPDEAIKNEEKRLPNYKIGEAVILSTQKESSTALVMNSSQAIYPGDRVTCGDK